MKFAPLLAGALIGFAILNVSAQDKVAASAPSTAERPRTIALISAVGDQFTYLRQRQSVGSNMEPYVRRVFTVPDGALDQIVLRGLDKALDQTDPDAKRVYMRLNPPEMAGVYAQNREEVAIGKIVSQLDKMPERMNWDRIIVVTPAYQFTAHSGMGSKMQGLGVYVLPLQNQLSAQNPLGLDETIGGMEEFDTVSPDDRSKKKKSKIYVAPYSYTQLWILDAKTLKVLQKETNKQSVRLYDPDSTALDVQQQFSIEKLATHIETFVERSSTRALKAATPEVTIEELKPGQAPAAK